MYQRINVLLLFILVSLLVGCGLETGTPTGLTSSMNSSSTNAVQVSVSDFRCEGRLPATSEDGFWQAQISYIGETEKNVYQGAGLLLVEGADQMPTGSFTCQAQGEMTVESVQVGDQIVYRSMLEVTKLGIFTDGFESGDVSFKAATVIGASFKGSDEELQAMLIPTGK
ncbi:MAG: hypothetical protein KC419_10960 [Anaerolineales bacterium]|nr:hypothetical protein [Anaerolineales bacterium]